ncbi:MAG: amidohydrolase family protein [Thermodesulfobacteriota bacterium]
MGEMTAHVSRWVLPVSGPPIDNGAVLVAGDRIKAVGSASEVLRGFQGQINDHGFGAILPGLVNCHTHLEFSALAGRVPPQERWEDWLALTLAAAAALTPPEKNAGLRRGLQALRDTGVALVGDISNTGESLPLLAASSLDYQFFFECLGFDLLDLGNLEEAFPFFATSLAADNPCISAGAHAPYSVSPALFKAVKRWNRERRRPQCVHLAESRAEEEFLARGDGFFKELLQARRRWVPDFRAPGLSPAAYLNSLDFWGPDTLAVHGVWLNAWDCALLAGTGAWVVLCPRANVYTGAGTPPLPELLQAGVPLALGTDSLAGNHDLNLFQEMLWLHQKYRHYPEGRWLRLGTLQGARALKRESDLGSLEPGKKAAMGFIPLSREKDYWEELYTRGAAGEWRWLGSGVVTEKDHGRQGAFGPHSVS